jgi:hypothetical protein
LPTSFAAVASTWLTVTTPVPPIPGIRIVADAGSRAGSGSDAASRGRLAAPVDRPVMLSAATVTKAGQSPLRQLASMLQLAWSTIVLRPNSVSIEWSDRQFDLTPQSPQPSHTRSSIMTRKLACFTRPRLRSRRFSAAHC